LSLLLDLILRSDLKVKGIGLSLGAWNSPELII